MVLHKKKYYLHKVIKVFFLVILKCNAVEEYTYIEPESKPESEPESEPELEPELESESLYCHCIGCCNEISRWSIVLYTQNTNQDTYSILTRIYSIQYKKLRSVNQVLRCNNKN